MGLVFYCFLFELGSVVVIVFFYLGFDILVLCIFSEYVWFYVMFFGNCNYLFYVFLGVVDLGFLGYNVLVLYSSDLVVWEREWEVCE